MSISNLLGFAKGVLIPFILAILVNVIFSFVFLGGWLNGATLSSTPVALLIFAAFLVGFPAIYLWMIRSYSVKKGIEFLYRTANPMTNKAIDAVVSSVVLSKQTMDESPDVVGNTLKSAAGFINGMDDVIPNRFKTVLTFILNRAPIIGTLRDIQTRTDFTPENLPLIQTEVKSTVANYIESELIGTPNIWLWLLLIINLMALSSAWYFFA